MLAQQIQEIFERDILKVRSEIASYKKEEDIWKVHGTVTNSAGTLCLHITGNLESFFGGVLAGNGFIRQRELEFSQRNISTLELLTGLDKALATVQTTLGNLREADLMKDYPIEFGGSKRPTMQVLMYLLAHLNYHLGQINYHRRLLAS